DLSLRAVNGVFELGNDGMAPLPEDAYELARDGERQRLRVRMRDAFVRPRRVVVQGDWHQPWFAARALGPLQAHLPNRPPDGVKWRGVGDVGSAPGAPGADMLAGPPGR